MNSQTLLQPDKASKAVGTSTSQNAQADLPRFGVMISGFRFVLPRAVLCDFLLRAQVFGMPKAPTRMIGLVHSRGFAIPVFDPSRELVKRNSLKLEEPLLIVGQGGQAGALLVDSPPQLLNQLGAPILDIAARLQGDFVSPWRCGHPIFEGLRGEAYLAELSDSAMFDGGASSPTHVTTSTDNLWWTIDFKSLFERLSQLKGQ